MNANDAMSVMQHTVKDYDVTPEELISKFSNEL